MHVHTVHTKYTFGDRVRYDSKDQGRAGAGVIDGITFGGSHPLAYLIIDDNGDGYAGIEESAITLIIADEAFHRAMDDTFRENDALYERLAK